MPGGGVRMRRLRESPAESVGPGFSWATTWHGTRASRSGNDQAADLNRPDGLPATVSGRRPLQCVWCPLEQGGLASVDEVRDPDVVDETGEGRDAALCPLRRIG